MRFKGIIVLVVTSLVLAAAIAPAFAQQYPNVSTLRPFSPEANFMSLPGYLRWVVFQQTAQWITYAEAARIVKQQVGSASP